LGVIKVVVLSRTVGHVTKGANGSKRKRTERYHQHEEAEKAFHMGLGFVNSSTEVNTNQRYPNTNVEFIDKWLVMGCNWRCRFSKD
jgi:hypothetical protein